LSKAYLFPVILDCGPFVKSIGLTAPAIGLLVALAFQALLISIAVGKSSQLSKAPILTTIFLSIFSFSCLTLLF
jgi:hypothetical protein